MSGAELRILIALNAGLLFTMSAAMAFVMRGHQTHGIRLWIGGSFALATGLALLGGRPFLPPFVSYMLANTLFGAGLAAQCVALRPPADRKLWIVWLAAYVLSFAVAYEVIRENGNPVGVRLIFISISAAVMHLLTFSAAAELYRRERGTGPLMIALAFGCLTLAFTVRAIGAANTNFTAEYMVAAPTITELAVTAVQVATTIFSQVGFVSLILERAAADRMRAREAALREEARRHYIEEENRELAELLDERSDTLDLLSHEIRQPLNNASAALESLAAVAMSGASEPGKLQNRIERAARVINDITLTLNNVIAAATSLRDRTGPMRLSATRLDEVVELALLSFPISAQERIARALPQAVDGVPLDPVLAGLAVRNLLDNALKYSPEDARVTLTVTVTEDEVVIEVANPGAPLPASERARVFEKRFRAGRSRLLPGAGLGLYIVRRVAELHGGRADMVSDGGMITARLRLPRSIAS